MPMRELTAVLSPPLSPATAQRRRSCATATSSPWRWWSKDRNLFDDNWIYIHDPA